MPQRYLVEFLAGERAGTRGLVWSVDYDEYMVRCPHEIKLISENPSPSQLLIDEKTGQIKGGVLSGSELQQMAVDPIAVEKFTSDQVKQLDKEHQDSQAEKARKDAIARERREVSRG